MTEEITRYLFWSGKIISGGQTGADRAGLDVARELNLDYGGYLPKGRKTEDGALKQKYDRMTELLTVNYPVRTEKNIQSSDATLIFTMGTIGKGTTLTMRLAQKHEKPFAHIDLNKHTDKDAILLVRKFMIEVKPQILNIAGTRGSKAIGIYERVYSVLLNSLSN